MTMDTSTNQSASTIAPGGGYGLVYANRTADAVKNRWQQGETPNLVAVLADHPELRRHRSVVLDLAYAEYRLRLQTGEQLDAETFARRFPSFQRSLGLLIEVHDLLSQDPELQALQENIDWPEAGSNYLQFNLIAEIGRGAFGRVFLATDPALGDRQIVVKIAPRAGGEAEILGKLRHPNIVPIYSLHEDPATRLAAFCMPYLGRATLSDVLDESFVNGYVPSEGQAILDVIADANDDLDTAELASPAAILKKGSYVDAVIHLAGQLAEALEHSHGRGIFHRDLKPSNVLMTPEGRPLLLDFNLSIDAGLPAWKIGGTLPYMAPEELANLVCTRPESQILHYDPRSDLFSLGVIVYELLTGKLPFGAINWDCSLEELVETLHQQQAKGPRPLQEWNGQVDRRLARLVESCLAFEPECRPETAQDLAAAFHRELSILRRGRRWIRNHQGRVLGLGAVLLTMTLAVGGYLALRPSYSDRQLQRGLAYSAEGDYSLAVECFNNALLDNPDSGKVLFARGRAYQREGRFQLAAQDYNSAFRLDRNPTNKACEGYCLSRIRLHGEAIGAYRSAIESGYDMPALLYNNIGYSHFQLGQIDDAEKSLTQAIKLDGNLQAAHYNLLVIFLQRAMQGIAIPKVALAHAERALEIGPCSGDLYYRVAALYTTAAEQDPTLIQPAIEYVAKAVEFGFKPEVFSSDVKFSALSKESAFRDALKRPVTVSKPRKATQLLDPLDAL